MDTVSDARDATPTLTLPHRGEGIFALERCLNQDKTYVVEKYSLPLRGRVRVGVNSSAA